MSHRSDRIPLIMAARVATASGTECSPPRSRRMPLRLVRLSTGCSTGSGAAGRAVSGGVTGALACSIRRTVADRTVTVSPGMTSPVSGSSAGWSHWHGSIW